MRINRKFNTMIITSILCISWSLTGCITNLTSKANEGANSMGVNGKESLGLIVETQYDRKDVIVADIIVTDEPYNADTTGNTDCTKIIQKAINDCANLGGGTVYLPKGKYKISKGLTISSFVTVAGDWQDPDAGNEYGTLIIADVESSESDLPALFTIYGSAGVYGLTIYYPNQNIDNVIPYPFTFYVPSHMLQSIVNCTVINGYKGVGAVIGAGGHEMMSIDTLKGTFLKVGATAYNQSDVGTWKNVTFSSKYWAQAAGGLLAADKTKIEAYTRANGTGMILGDLEWTQFANVSISGYDVGMNIVKGKRIEFAGSIYGLTIDECNTGLKVDFIDERWGMVIANSKISGSKNSIINNTKGIIKLAGTIVIGEKGGTGADKIEQQNTDIPKPQINYDAKYQKPVSKIYNVALKYNADKTGVTDSSVQIQKALDDAKTTGGIVYMPAGFYRLDNALTVPMNVELRGSSPIPNRDQSNMSLGTVILSYFGDDNKNYETDTALITLNGENAGANGFRVFYPENNPASKSSEKVSKKFTYTIRGNSKGVYAVNLTIANGYNGIEFDKCDNFLIKKVITACYNKTIYISNSSNGTIEGCLQNETATVRNGLLRFADFKGWVTEAQIFDYLINPISRKNTTYITLISTTNQTVFNCFAYGVNVFLESKNSINNVIFNIGADNLGETGYLIKTSGGSAAIINMMRYNGRSVSNDSTNKTDIKVYNRLTISNKGELDILE